MLSSQEASEITDQFVNTPAFIRRFDSTTIVADTAFLPLLEPVASQLRIVSKETVVPENQGRLGNRVLVCFSTADQEFGKRIATLTSVTAVDFWRDWVLPMSVRRPESSSRDRPTPNLRASYSILTQPRTGSTFLSHQMESNGIGRPREHLRGYISAALEQGLVMPTDLLQWWGQVTEGEQLRGLFGTKLIFQYYRRLADALRPSRSDFAKDILGGRVIRIRRDITAIAVSDYIAHQAGVWHIWSSRERAAYERALANFVIDDEALVSRYLAFDHDERAIDSLLSQSDVPVFNVDFDELTLAPSTVIARLGLFLNVRPQLISLPPRNPEEWVTRSERHREAHERLLTLLGRRSEFQHSPRHT